MRTIAIINQKSGVGKTTTTANLAHALALDGYQVVALDLDPQGHLGASFGVDPGNCEGMDEVLLYDAVISDFIIEVRDGVKLVPAGTKLGRLEKVTTGGAKRTSLLKDALQGQFENRDFVLIDCPPASGLLVVNALFCANEVLVPVNNDYLSLQGVSYMMGIFKKFEQTLGHQFREWFVLTRYHRRHRLPEEVIQRLKHYFPEKVFQTRIRETAALAECPGFGKTIFEYCKSSHGAADYRSLASELASSPLML